MNTGRNKIVSCAFGGGFDKVRSFDFHKAVFVVIIACGFYDFVAHHKDILHFAAAKVEITVFKAKVLFCVAVIADFKRRGLAFCKDEKFGNKKLNCAGCNFGVDGFAFADNAFCFKNKFCSYGSCFFKNFFIGAVAESKLKNAASVAKVDEDKVAEVAGFLCPTENDNFFADMAFVEFTAICGAVITVDHLYSSDTGLFIKN